MREVEMTDDEKLEGSQKEKLQGIYKPGLFQPSGTKRTPLFDMDRVWSLLDGAIDIHVHSGPEAYTTRVADELQMSIEACEVGMAAVVYKCHAVPTSRSTNLLQTVVNRYAVEHNKGKVDLFGGVVLNYAVGGLNPEAVVVNDVLGGKYVWLPTLDASYHHQGMDMSGGIEVLNENGEVVAPLKEIFGLIAESDMVLGICHQSTKERFLIIDEAQRIGVKKIEVIHPLFEIYKMTIDELKELVARKVYIGFYCWSLTEALFDAELALRTINEVGSDYLVAGTDVGFFIEDRPVEAMRRFVTWMLVSGIPDKTVERIVKLNARELLY
jgi:predicted metal-dependent TIM-barrel fold hydrolase